MTKQKSMNADKKKYSKPLITRVELVPEQVVLGNCRTDTSSNRAAGPHCKWGQGNPCSFF